MGLEIAITLVITIPLVAFIIALIADEQKGESKEPTTKPIEETVVKAKAKLTEAFSGQSSTTTSPQYYSKISAREALTKIADGTITAEVVAWAQAEVTRLDQNSNCGTTLSIKKENQPIADAIVTILSQGKMLSTDLAVAIGQTVVKTNGIAHQMEKLGILTKSKVKVNGKGEMSCYELCAD